MSARITRCSPARLEPERTQPVPIGIGCENMEVFAVGDDGQLVTDQGKEGELWRVVCVSPRVTGAIQRKQRAISYAIHTSLITKKSLIGQETL